MPPTKFRGAAFWPAAAIVLAAGWVYSPAFYGGWIWDDAAEVAQNPVLRHASGLRKIWFAPESPDYFPLKSTVQWVQWHLWGARPLGYHLTNVGLHVLCALLLWRLLEKLGARWAWAGGLLLAVHPLAVESVAWVAEMKNTLSLAFLLLGIICYVDFDASGERFPLQTKRWRVPLPFNPSGSGTRQRFVSDSGAQYFLSLAFFLAAMLSKSSVVMFPGVLLLYAWWRRGRVSRADVRAVAPFFVISIVLGLVTVWFQQQRAIAGTDLALGGVLSRVAAAGLAIAFYFRQCVFPTGLMAIYPRWTVDPPLVWQFWPWVGLGLVLVLIWLGTNDAVKEGPSSPAGPAVAKAVAGKRGLRRGNFFRGLCREKNCTRTAFFGLGTFLINLAPVLGFVPMAYLRISWVADHLAYLPLVSIVALAASSAGALAEGGGAPGSTPGRGSWRRAVAGLLLAVVTVAWAGQSRGEAGRFRDEEAFWGEVLRRNPAAWVAHNERGRILLRGGQPVKAEAEFEAALRLNPQDAEAHFNLGLALEKTGRGPAAMSQYEEALRLKPDLSGADASLGAALLRAGRLPEAIARLREALRLRPDEAEVRVNLGVALAAAGRRAEAEAELGAVLRESPGYPEANYNLANVLAQEGRSAEAIAHYERALRGRPDYAEAHVNLGIVLAGSRRWPEARAEFEQALRLRPDDRATRENLARVEALERVAPGGP